MKIDDIPAIFGQQQSQKPIADDAGSGSFAEMMAASVPVKTGADETTPMSDLEFIRKKGFAAYAEEVEKKKMEELRERILHRMGLSEDDLENMPAEQRAAIEDLIAREIQRRMQANAETENGDKGTQSGTPDLARTIADPAGMGGAGTVLLAALEARSTVAESDAPRSKLPGDEEEVS